MLTEHTVLFLTLIFSIHYYIERINGEPLLEKKMTVFDLDNVIWPFKVDTAPDLMTITKSQHWNTSFTIFPEVPEVLQSLKSKNYYLAAMERCNDSEKAHNLLKHFNISKYFDFTEIGNSPVVQQIERLLQSSSVPNRNLLYITFDPSPEETIRLLDLDISPFPAGENGLDKRTMKNALFIFTATPFPSPLPNTIEELNIEDDY